MAEFVKIKRMTAQEYVDTYPETTQPMELIDGELIVSPAPVPGHQSTVVTLTLVIGNFLKSYPLGELQVSPSDLHLDEHNVVQPDLYFVAKTNTNCRIGEHGYWQGAPDLCIEIVSPSSTRRDRLTKFNLYQKHGVREYWLVESQGRYIEVYILEDGKFQRQGAYDETQSFTSLVLPDLTVNVAQIFPPEAPESASESESESN